MADSVIQEIKDKLDIVDVISSYIKLEKTGANYRALCPFHADKKPSFFVSPVRQIWKCFGCGAGGGIFDFVMKVEGIEFGDALRVLAKKAGVELKRENPKIQTARKRAYEICEWATKFFEKQLHEGSLGKKAKEYLLKRGITEESIKKWRIGFAPDTWDSLLNFLKQKGFTVGEIERVGLVLQSEKGKVYDRFRGRIIFPIFDLNSQVVGFGGRVFEKSQDAVQKKSESVVAKYLNIPNTLLYNKSKILYGLNRAKVPIRKEDECVLVEGYTDVIMSHQAGVENAVAVSGTALTPLQLSILKRYSNNLVTAFDMDIAGDSATKRGIDLAQAQGFNIKVAVLPKGKDPADVVTQKKEDWGKLIKSAKSILKFYFDDAFSKFDNKSPEGKRAISKMIIPVIKRIQNKIEQSSWIKELARQLEVSEESVVEEVNKYSSSTKQSVSPEKPISIETKKTRREIIEEKLLSLLLNYAQGLGLLEDKCLECFSSRTKEILKKFKKNAKSLSNNLDKFEFPQEVREFLDFLALRGEVEIEASGEEIDLEEEILVCLKELECLTIKEKIASLSEKIRQAESEGDSEAVEELSKELNQLTEELSQNNNR